MMIILSLFIEPKTDAVAILLLQIFLTLIISKLLSKLLSSIHQPGVIGQIIAGIILGPSVCGFIPNYTNTIFPTNSTTQFSTLANLGLIFFMFFLGLELDPAIIKNRWKMTLPLACTSILIPFGVGAACSIWLTDINNMPDINHISFLLFIGAGIGFSAFPVLAALLNSLNLLTDEIGILTISLAAIEDICVWVILAVASGLASNGAAISGLYTVLIVFGFMGIMLLFIQPILHYIDKQLIMRNDEYNIYYLVSIFLLLIVASLATELANIHAFFGAFITGLIVPKTGNITSFLALRIELIIIEFFLPLYFVNSGLNTEVYLLNTGSSWLTLLELILVASAAKIIPLTLVAKFLYRKSEESKSWRYYISIGLLMNTRGIVQLVVLNIAVQEGILSKQLFAIFVLMATFMTFVTSPAIHLLYKNKYKVITNDENDQIAAEFETLKRAISHPQLFTAVQSVIEQKQSNLHTIAEVDTNIVDTYDNTGGVYTIHNNNDNNAIVQLYNGNELHHSHSNQCIHCCKLHVQHNHTVSTTDPEIVSPTYDTMHDSPNHHSISIDTLQSTHHCCSAVLELAQLKLRLQQSNNPTHSLSNTTAIPQHDNALNDNNQSSYC